MSSNEISHIQKMENEEVKWSIFCHDYNQY